MVVKIKQAAFRKHCHVGWNRICWSGSTLANFPSWTRAVTPHWKKHIWQVDRVENFPFLLLSYLP